MKRTAKNRRFRLRLPLTLALGGVCAAPFVPGVAHAQLQLGQIQGVITNQDNGKPLQGVTIVVSGPALQGEQSEITDKSGSYLITQLPPGDGYIIRFYFGDVVVERPGVRISQSKTLTVSLSMPTQKGKNVYVVKERAPAVDTATANTGVEINQEILQNTAVRGRTFESAMSLAPGSADVAPRSQAGGDVGVSFAGGTGNENAVLVDGLNTTDLGTGVVATQLHQYFIKDLNIITGGYQAEYGRATGGVVSIVTKTGSNEFHGGVFGSWSPYQATPTTVARLGEALAFRSKQFQQYDFGFELGGPILKDRIWFYVGFAPTFTINRTERVVRTQVKSQGKRPDGSWKAEIDPDYRDPDYLASDILYAPLRSLALRTEEVPEESRLLDEYARLYNWIAKLQFNLSPDHNITLGYIGAPEFRSEYDGYASDTDATKIDRSKQIHDATVHYVGKLFDRKLQIDVIYGYHYQGLQELPNAENKQYFRYRSPANDDLRGDLAFSLGDFENISRCRVELDPTTRKTLWNPCPVTSYVKNGYGQYKPNQVLQRHAVQASGTFYGKLLGTHGIKLGFDFEDNLSDNTRKYSGVDFDPSDPASGSFNGRLAYETDASGTGVRIRRGFGTFEPFNRFGDAGVPCGVNKDRYCYNSFRAVTETRNYALYLRDQWSVANVGLVLNAGIRWEAQEIFGADGSKQIAIYDNVAPRVGATWDPTRKGRAKIYAQYGRFYQSIPMDINDRSFSGEGLLVGSSFTKDCAKESISPTGIPVVVAKGAPGSPCSLSDPRVSGGGVFAPVAPYLKGQFLDEVVGGAQYDLGLDIVVGAYYTYRWLGSIVEDLSVNGGNTFFIANPGAEPDPKVAADLQTEADRLKRDASAAPTDAKLQKDADMAQRRAEVYKAQALFPKATRDYHAITLTLQKRLSNRFSILANYTYSRLLGNYPGPFSPYNNQLDPNISVQYDIIDLTVNRNGPLNNDRPHNFKATGFFQQPVFGGSGTIVASLTFTAISGRPIQVLGQHNAYGARNTFILPSGSAGRTPTITQLDAHLAYEHQLTKEVKLSVYGDVVNLANQRAVANVDDEYTFSVVNPIAGGKVEDLPALRTLDGQKPILNSNYGQPTAYQSPLYLRFGARLSF
ncbi:MAG TPA: hypothetical protein PKI49_03720 [Pseudomonadota bacterium]|jgi:hypothetical protein|nr:hypothetical protein [Pseudomonadota bacterium]HNK45273.1 hypothetical protein [Pseudomonadota bacterium]HNN50138.1 hypothetical protein [Pseudomonadota bacterium]HNO67594.1 hypothetical protein [Pseudomonadota bacterium]